jgi:hypothetical protein
MFILLEAGMTVILGDFAYINGTWATVNPDMAGCILTSKHIPIKRKIKTVDYLFASYNSSLTKSQFNTPTPLEYPKGGYGDD